VTRHLRTGSRSRIALVFAAALALHLAAIVGLNHHSWTTPRTAPPVQRVSLRLIPNAPSSVPPSARPNAAPPAPVPAATHSRKSAPSAPHDVREPDAATLHAVAAAIAPEPAASAPDTLPSLMDTDATRRAIRASARAP